jgi:hypothetical protein
VAGLRLEAREYTGLTRWRWVLTDSSGAFLAEGDAAIGLERDALRYKDLSGDVHGIAVGYHNLGNYLHHHARQPAPALASHLAGLIHALAETGLADDSAGAAAEDLREFGSAAVPPRDVASLCADPGGIPGTDLPGLIAQAQELADASATELPRSRARSGACRPGRCPCPRCR